MAPIASLTATLLLSLRIVPTIAFAQPFTLIGVPAIVRVLLAIAIAGWSQAGHTPPATLAVGALAVAAGTELATGIALSLALQIAFAALLTVGRALDVQAGLGLAALIDPTTRAGMPLIGTVFAYAAAALFFAGSGPDDLLAIWSASLDAVPLGSVARGDVTAAAALLSSAFAAACGLGGAIMVALFLCDLAIAFMSRTLPQMNVMLLGFQVKTLVTLALLPPAIAAAGTMLARLLRLAIGGAPGLIGR